MTGHQPVAGPPLPLTQRWAIAGLAATGILHLALPIGHHDNALLTVGFVAAGAAYLWLATRVLRQRSWRLLTALLVTANLVGYLIIITAGGEEPDQVGILTALDELMLLALALNGPTTRRLRRAAASTATVASVVLVGVVIWISSFAAHQASDLDATLTTSGGTSGAVIDAPHDDGHQHDHAARAQAGVIMRALANHHPTAEQIRAAEQLASPDPGGHRPLHRHPRRCRRRIPAQRRHHRHRGPPGKQGPRHQRLHPRRRPPTGAGLRHRRRQGEPAGRGLPHARRRASRARPREPRSPAGTRTTSASPPCHRVRVSPSPFGGCSALSIGATMPEMMHVWTVSPPGGPYAESIDQKWAYDYNATHGVPWPN